MVVEGGAWNMLRGGERGSESIEWRSGNDTDDRRWEHDG
jgi:hypothetical protein